MSSTQSAELSTDALIKELRSKCVNLNIHTRPRQNERC